MDLYFNRTVKKSDITLWHGDAVKCLNALPPETVDLIITSPPYFIGKEYDSSSQLGDFSREIRRILPSIARSLKQGGSVCWQVGNHVQGGRVTPLDFLVGAAMSEDNDMVMRNRIVWTFGHGTHAARRFSGRHETILWYTKGENYYFDLDSARVPQIYPGKRHYKGPQKGQLSGNPLGKNPGDYWEIGEIWKIPNVNSNHVEKTDHPCQFPIALARRLVTALAAPGALVVDPYVGSGSTAVAALLEGRNFIGGDTERRYLEICEKRIFALNDGTLRVRADLPSAAPAPNQSVSKLPPHFKAVRETTNG